MTARGVFITLEGGDGTGKSTQAKLLQQALAAQGRNIVATREPGGAPQAEKIRDLLLQRDSGDFDPLTEVLLLFAARREHIVNRILPALAAGQWVISDRFADSSRAFQGYGMGVPLEAIENLYELVAGDMRPDLTFVFDIDPEIGLARSLKRHSAQASGEDRYERMGLAFHQRLRQGFLEIARQEPERCVVIDAAGDAGDIHRRILETVEARFGAAVKEARHG
jgi:dTMP kinase